MSLNHAVVWLDHQEAHVFHFNAEGSEGEVIKSKSKHHHLHHKNGAVGSGNTPLEPAYLHEVAAAVADAREILVVGPGSAKLELLKHAQQHDPAVAARLVGVETVDHPTDGQLLAYAKKYFVKVDAMKGDSVIAATLGAAAKS